jgi:staphylococcal nuclease domain-containing protein 1
MGRRPAVVETPAPTEIVSDETDGEVESSSSLTTAQRLAASTAVANEVLPDPYAKEAKHFTEIRVLNRDVS